MIPFSIKFQDHGTTQNGKPLFYSISPQTMSLLLFLHRHHHHHFLRNHQSPNHHHLHRLNLNVMNQTMSSCHRLRRTYSLRHHHHQMHCHSMSRHHHLQSVNPLNSHHRHPVVSAVICPFRDVVSSLISPVFYEAASLLFWRGPFRQIIRIVFIENRIEVLFPLLITTKKSTKQRLRRHDPNIKMLENTKNLEISTKVH